jgi:hypothetical protein
MAAQDGHNQELTRAILCTDGTFNSVANKTFSNIRGQYRIGHGLFIIWTEDFEGNIGV